jgi:hypothetical protein
MKIYNEEDVEIKESDVDTTKGYLKSDKKFITHYDEQPEVIEHKHYEVERFVFEDGSQMLVDGNTDAHVKVIDDQAGIFEYVDQGEGNVYHGAEIKSVIDQEHVEHKDAYDEYEDIQRYVLYTEEELAARKEAEEKQAKQTAFLENGPDQLESNTTSIGDLTIMLSEIVAGSDE